MSAIGFRCPNGDTVTFKDCLEGHCDPRCMALPALNAAEKSTHHWFGKPSVTQLLAPTRIMYLSLKSDYYIDPLGTIAAMIGTNSHKAFEDAVPDGWKAEVRLEDDITSGAFDSYDPKTKTLFDWKFYGAYKIAKMIGMMPKWEKKTIMRGKRKGQEQWIQTFVSGGVKWTHDVAWQLNYYRLLMKKHGYPVKHMYVNCFVRGGVDKTAKSYGSDKASYLIPINFISDKWVRLYFKTKHDRLMYALEHNEMPPVCKRTERWDTSKSYPDRRCRDYCSVNKFCPYYKENYGG